MLYPRNIETKLGFDKIREELTNACESSLGQAFVQKINFSNDKKRIAHWLEQAAEFTRIIQSGELFPNSNYIDISGYLVKAQVENSFLLEEEFFELILALKTLDKCLDFFSDKKEEYPTLTTLADGISFEDRFLWRLDGKFDDRGKLHDRASDALFEIRAGIRSEQQRLRKVLDNLLKRAKKEGFTPDDNSITIRDGRMVIPLLAEHKRRIKGFIHGESATGQTVYLEPAEVLEINNEVKELQYAERREIIRILTELTDELRPQIPELEGVVKFLGLIDFIRAKARVAIHLDAVKPSFAQEKGFIWNRARHPLLLLAFEGQKREVVPLDIYLNHRERILLISGPNAGGKSVCLKTVGLVQYMFQCGLLVPVDEHSEFTVFNDLFIDIGDEQSIENDLSTYSSHLMNMKFFLGHTDKRTLFLIDEFGTGTEPQFGGAIAEAILTDLVASHGLGVITTHYGNLKEYADAHKGLLNGAMKYDLKQLRPLYQLEIGKPGSSFALEIARKIGLPNSTIEKAKKKLGVKQVSLEQLLGELESQKYDLEKAEKRIKAKERDLDEASNQYHELKSHLENQEKRVLQKAKSEAAGLLKNANKEIERVIREIRENEAEKERVKELRKEMETLHSEVSESTSEAPVQDTPVKVIPGEIKVGDHVRIKGQEAIGQVISIKGKDAELSLGALSSWVKINRLEKTTRKERREQKQAQGVRLNEKMTQFSSRLDIRGHRVEEVMGILDKFIDEAILLGMNELVVLHGKGTGALREVVRNHLKNYKEVESMRDEHADRGGAGITIVELK